MASATPRPTLCPVCTQPLLPTQPTSDAMGYPGHRYCVEMLADSAEEYRDELDAREYEGRAEDARRENSDDEE